MSQTSHPHLADHSIDGNAVVPVVYAVEWFARVARDARPDLFVREILELKVLKGISLPGFFEGAVTSLALATEVESESSRQATLVLRLADLVTGRPYYSCRVRLTSDAPVTSTVEPFSLQAADDDVAGDAAHYGGVLFHGADFQVLNSIVGMSEAGCAASIDGVVTKGWPQEPWTTDPALLDGGLQLALLWNEFMVGRPSLPTAIASIRLFSAPVAGPLTCTLSARESTDTKSRCDIVFSDADGNVAAQLTGVETHNLPAS